MNRTFKYRLFTTANQERELSRTLETHRRLYNDALDGKQLCWETAGSIWNFYEQSEWLTVRRGRNPHLANVNAKSAQNTLRRLDKTFQAFFRRVNVGDSPGYPRFKNVDNFVSFTFLNGNGCRVVDRKLRLQYIGTIRVRWHRELPDGAKIKQATILRKGGKWFVCFAVEMPDPICKPPKAKVGIDVGLKSFVTTSKGESLGDSRSLENALPELRRRQRALTRCEKGSNRRKGVKLGVQRLHTKVANCRRDMHHKVARSLVNRYGVIAAESLSVIGMLGNRRLARRVADAGWGQFISILCSKAESAGCDVILVDPKNTSQQCSNCGEMVRKSLAVRVHKCACGCTLDRDENAARNILGRAGPKSRNVVNRSHGSKSQRLIAVK